MMAVAQDLGGKALSYATFTPSGAAATVRRKREGAGERRRIVVVETGSSHCHLSAHVTGSALTSRS